MIWQQVPRFCQASLQTSPLVLAHPSSAALPADSPISHDSRISSPSGTAEVLGPESRSTVAWEPKLESCMTAQPFAKKPLQLAGECSGRFARPS